MEFALTHMQTEDFNFHLPPELIAQSPAPARDESRLLVLDRGSGNLTHRTFRELPGFLRAGDVLVLNDSRVIPARLRATNARTNGRFEILLLEENAPNDWWVMLRPGKRARAGTQMLIATLGGKASGISAEVIDVNGEGHRRLHFSGVDDLRHRLDDLGEMPVPPYIEHTKPEELAADKVRYQTVYARAPGSVAAPTAGLHFTEALLTQLRANGVRVCFVTLHVGPGTFAPVKAREVAGHVMHEEYYEVGEETAREVNQARAEGRRVVAVGTTSIRVLESVAALNNGMIVSGHGRTKIFIYPPYAFRIVDALLTNFHLPCSTLLMLVSAFASPKKTSGRELILAAYAEAIRERYRFFSYGDAMFIM